MFYAIRVPHQFSPTIHEFDSPITQDQIQEIADDAYTVVLIETPEQLQRAKNTPTTAHQWAKIRALAAQIKEEDLSKTHNLLNRSEFGEAIFQKIKAEIESRGHSLWPKKFPPDYPVSRRVLYDIKRGRFKIETLNRLPDIEVREWFEIL